MSVITQKILKYHRIYCKNTLSEEDILEAQKVSNYLKNELPIEKLYLYGSTVYGFPNSKSDYDFLLVLDGEETFIEQANKKYCHVNNLFSRPVHTVSTPLFGFKKRTLQPTDMEFYIDSYGILLYDTNNTPKVKVKIHSAYSVLKNNYTFLKGYTSPEDCFEIFETYFTLILRLYACKMAYSPLEEVSDINTIINYVSLFADNTVQEVIREYKRLKMDQSDSIIFADFIKTFSDYVFELKQEKNTATLKFIF